MGVSWWAGLGVLLRKLLPPCSAAALRGASGDRWLQNRNGIWARVYDDEETLRFLASE